jgi:hypothetical protein
MSIDAIMEHLYAMTQPLPNIGHVYTMELSDIQPAEVETYLGWPDHTSPRGWSIRAWQWFRRGFECHHLDTAGYVTETTHHVHGHGWWEVQYAQQSERDWRTMTDTICALFHDPLALIDVAQRFTAPVSTFEGRAVLNETYRCHDIELVMDIMEVTEHPDFAEG